MCNEESGKTAADSHGSGVGLGEDTCDAYSIDDCKNGVMYGATYSGWHGASCQVKSLVVHAVTILQVCMLVSVIIDTGTPCDAAAMDRVGMTGMAPGRAARCRPESRFSAHMNRRIRASGTNTGTALDICMKIFGLQ